MGVFDKFLDIMKLNDDEYDDDDFLMMMILKMMISMKKSASFNFPETRRAEVMILMISIWTRTSILPQSSGNKVTPMRQPAARRGVNMEVCVVKADFCR